MHLPCSGLLDKCRLHPVADAAWLKLVVMMMMADDRLLLETLHRRAAHVQRLLQAEHGRRGGGGQTRTTNRATPATRRRLTHLRGPAPIKANRLRGDRRRGAVEQRGRRRRTATGPNPIAFARRKRPREISADLQPNRDLRAAGESLFFDYIDRHTTRSGLYTAGCLHVRRRTSPSLSQSGAASPGRGVAAPS